MRSSFYKTRELTPEEKELDRALDDHREALKDEKQFMAIAVALYFIGLALSVFGSKDSPVEHIGSGLLICAILAYGIHLALGFRTRKYRYIAKDLLDAYERKKAMPFYQELTEMFAKKPEVHLHLNDNGSITVTDKRKKTQGEGGLHG